MAESKALTKRFEEFNFPSVNITSIAHGINNSAEMILPFLLNQFKDKEVYIFNFAESPNHLIYLCKRSGLNLSKMSNFHNFDFLSLLSDMVDEHYPITSFHPATHFQSENNVSKSENGDALVASLIKNINDSIQKKENSVLIFNGLHFLYSRFKCFNENSQNLMKLSTRKFYHIPRSGFGSF